MAVTSLSSNNKINDFISTLAKDFPDFCFCSGKKDHWSPTDHKITYNLDRPTEELKCSLLHELAHAILDHKNYASDIELLKLEGEAWEKAAVIGKKYHVTINEEHIQCCLDSYRDWLHRRSTCPDCGIRVLQTDSSNYECFNCHKKWQVSPDRFMRSYRKTKTA